MKHIRLSICIPTYNFGEFIGTTLESIIKQATAQVEIVVVDGASTDNTAEVVSGFQKRFKRLRYYRREENKGVDRDLATAIELARGDYCWLMSADDALKPGSLRLILQEISLGFDTYICNRTLCDRNLKPVRDECYLFEKINDQAFDFSNQQQMLLYFNLSKSLGALFSYISSIIFLRRNWDTIFFNPKFIGSYYLHVYVLFSSLKQTGKHKYIKQSLVLCRGDNDSFLTKDDQGIARRYLIDIEGYHQLGADLFSDSITKQAFLKVMTRTSVYFWFKLIRLGIRIDDHKWKDVKLKLLDCGYKPYQLCLISITRQIEAIVPILKIIRMLKGESRSFVKIWLRQRS